MDVIDLHFVEDVDGVAVGGGLRGFDDDFEPGRVGAAFLIEEYGADGSLIDGFSGGGVRAFIIIDAVVLAEQEGDDGGFSCGRRGAVGGEVKGHHGRFGQFGAVDKKGDEEEAEVYHRGEVDAGGEFFGFGDAAGFAGHSGSGDFGHGVWFWNEMRGDGDSILKVKIGGYKSFSCGYS